MKSLYTAHATATRGGRGIGTSATDDAKVSVNLSAPREMGGEGGPGTNPEQLFAVGYSASFLGTMKTAARREDKQLPDEATITAAISFVDREDNVGFALAAALEAHVPGMDKAEVEALMHKAHDICPYSWAIKQVVDVKFSVA